MMPSRARARGQAGLAKIDNLHEFALHGDGTFRDARRKLHARGGQWRQPCLLQFIDFAIEFYGGDVHLLGIFFGNQVHMNWPVSRILARESFGRAGLLAAIPDGNDRRGLRKHVKKRKCPRVQHSIRVLGDDAARSAAASRWTPATCSIPCLGYPGSRKQHGWMNLLFPNFGYSLQQVREERTNDGASQTYEGSSFLRRMRKVAGTQMRLYPSTVTRDNLFSRTAIVAPGNGPLLNDPSSEFVAVRNLPVKRNTSADM